MRKPSVGIIFLTVFIDLIGFGLVIPLIPLYGKDFHATGWQIGALMSTFSFMQFLFAQSLGRLSDRVGRRPVLLLSTAGAAIAYAIFGYGSSLQGHTALIILFISRAVAGTCGANITVAQAYIADITPPAERSKKMGLIGMAFGLGFVLGPVLGIVAYAYWGRTGPGWVASALCASNFILAFCILPESRKAGSDHAAQRPHFDQWMHTLSRPKVGLLVGVFFLATFCFTCFETTLGLLMLKTFGIDTDTREGATQVGLLFIYAGLVGAVFQGGATGRLVKLLGEPKLVAVSLFCVALSLVPMPFVTTKPGVYLLLGLLAIGSSMTRPPVFGMISNLTDPREQGVTIGVAQSAGGLARVIGPTFSSTLFFWIAWTPYVICGALALFTGLIAWQLLSRNYVPPPATEVPEAPA